MGIEEVVDGRGGDVEVIRVARGTVVVEERGQEDEDERREENEGRRRGWDVRAVKTSSNNL